MPCLRTSRRSLASTKWSDPACCIGSSAKCSGAMMSSTNAVLRRRCEGGRPERIGGGESGLFYVRRHPCAEGSFEWYVLNDHTRRRASKFFPTRAAAAAEREKLQARLDWPRQKCSGERRKAESRLKAWRRPLRFSDVCGNERISPALGDIPQARPLSPLSVSLGLGTPPSGPPPWRGSACCADASGWNLTLGALV